MNTETTTPEITKDDIKALWKQVKNKTDFIERLANDLEKSPLTLRQHWFGSFFAVPADLRVKVKTAIENEIKAQAA